MRVEISGLARFRFRVTKKLVEELMELSRLHYDGQCQTASMRIGATVKGRRGHTQPIPAKNGVLVVWHDRFDPKDAWWMTQQVFASFNELDLVAKVCEPYHPRISVDARNFHFQLLRAMQIAEKVQRDWEHVAEVS